MVHLQRRRLPRRHVEDEALRAGFSPWRSQLPPQESEQGDQRVESLLRPLHQWRSPALGQRRRSFGRNKLRTTHGVSCASNPKGPRSISKTSGSVSCHKRTIYHHPGEPPGLSRWYQRRRLCKQRTTPSTWHGGTLKAFSSTDQGCPVFRATLGLRKREPNPVRVPKSWHV